VKGIILAGGTGTRMRPLSAVLNKHLLPVFDKPMIYFPLSYLIDCGIREILIITSPGFGGAFRQLLGNGSRFGVTLQYEEQSDAAGVPEAFLIGARFVNNDPVCLVLGDNVFIGLNLPTFLCRLANGFVSGGLILGCHVKDPRPYGVVKSTRDGEIIGLEEKPANFTVDHRYQAVPGLYFYDSSVTLACCRLEPSQRVELEIMDLNAVYFGRGLLEKVDLPSGVQWYDAGTPESLLRVARCVHAFQKRHGVLVGSPEAAAYRRNFITKEQLQMVASRYGYAHPYGAALLRSIGAT
jgi:glucose-1-phosphate thymidylyltransferase